MDASQNRFPHLEATVVYHRRRRWVNTGRDDYRTKRRHLTSSAALVCPITVALGISGIVKTYSCLHSASPLQRWGPSHTTNVCPMLAHRQFNEETSQLRGHAPFRKPHYKPRGVHFRLRLELEGVLLRWKGKNLLKNISERRPNVYMYIRDFTKILMCWIHPELRILSGLVTR